ncbi:hypothetical protein RvY_03594 [Ramazzottius varieornatus]|uniref:Uncharacterized protein n=1 Tax=Ramazzottius varieornatus TaxID=947166 RepID=A0A1D1UVR5_RAMVA|nr:hypothetical protein RvY_03594 [Ramazzottius varieornatus]
MTGRRKVFASAGLGLIKHNCIATTISDFLFEVITNTSKALPASFWKRIYASAIEVWGKRRNKLFEGIFYSLL